ncbi:VOC family protein [Fulvivirga sp. 29W222]|uniref:VOC family protein n=1 Tax=Fulvivirga marina TaxID=2494733 RepID=A0A937FZL6_9BACT|nr:VOC family protein [Fulvivirga marina]MBL6447270.1 VOC family protein [Fulvivirga marina]
MRRIKFITSAVLLSLSATVFAQSDTDNKSIMNMKMNAGVITRKLKETRKFYTEVLGFGVTFENEFYLLMHTPNKQAELSFLLPNHPTQQPIFQPAFEGKGMYLTIEVDDVDAIYREIKQKNVEIIIDIRDEAWGDRHFTIQDPNGIGVDIVTYSGQG